MKNKFIYQVVTLENGKIESKNLDLETLLSSYDKIGENNNLRNRIELQKQPILKDFCGPMYNGEENGKVVIRYESQEVNDQLSV